MSPYIHVSNELNYYNKVWHLPWNSKEHSTHQNGRSLFYSSFSRNRGVISIRWRYNICSHSYCLRVISFSIALINKHPWSINVIRYTQNSANNSRKTISKPTIIKIVLWSLQYLLSRLCRCILDWYSGNLWKVSQNTLQTKTSQVNDQKITCDYWRL